MKTINRLLPDPEALAPMVENIKAIFAQQGVTDYVSEIIKNMHENAAMLMNNHQIDTWIGYGNYLPAIEKIIALNAGQSEEYFYARTEYPVNVVDAYTVVDNPLATLIAADQFFKMHRRIVPCTTTIWALDEDETYFINLDDYENRLRHRKR
ncbi:hypothetical protein [Acinetobacter sp. Marseille-Q1623]|nr:hypothetical protein [Acinetobacter sp. Marseille-Q1623]